MVAVVKMVTTVRVARRLLTAGQCHTCWCPADRNPSAGTATAVEFFALPARPEQAQRTGRLCQSKRWGVCPPTLLLFTAFFTTYPGWLRFRLSGNAADGQCYGLALHCTAERNWCRMANGTESSLIRTAMWISVSPHPNRVSKKRYGIWFEKLKCCIHCLDVDRLMSWHARNDFAGVNCSKKHILIPHQGSCYKFAWS